MAYLYTLIAVIAIGIALRGVKSKQVGNDGLITSFHVPKDKR